MTYSMTRGALGATDILTARPELGRPQYPIHPFRIGGHGAFNEVRRSPADGACGVGSYPCTHPGVDVAGYAGTEVVAPEDGVVVATSNGEGSPFGGYGPWLIVLRGASGKYHLLAHLAPATAGLAPINATFRAGQKVGVTSSANHTHWEVRKRAVPLWDKGENNGTNNLDPIAWLASQRGGISSGGLVLLGGAALLGVLLYRRR